jgi:glyoxylase-like metal-dependent hydrolase (beta-lactamase superfamily II)
MQIEAFFHAASWTVTYLVYDPESCDAVVIDPALDFDPAAMSITTPSADALVERIDDLGLNVLFVLETHAHADHLTAADVLRERLDAQVVIGAPVTAVQETFAGVFELDGFVADGADFDVLVHDGQEISAGTLSITAIATPGHTPACTSFLIQDALFVGDAIFMPDSGTGRCDFPAGSAEVLWDSLQRIFALPEDTRVFVGHDYQPGGRELAYETTVAACRTDNVHLTAETSKDEFVAFRTGRDKTLKVPRHILPALQVNISAGKLPEPSATGRSFLKMPINLFG